MTRTLHASLLVTQSNVFKLNLEQLHTTNNYLNKSTAALNQFHIPWTRFPTATVTWRPHRHGKWSAFIQHFYPKRFTISPDIHPFTHTITHRSGVNHARRQPARREQLGLGALLRETSTHTKPGIELATLLPANPLYLLSYCLPRRTDRQTDGQTDGWCGHPPGRRRRSREL